MKNTLSVFIDESSDFGKYDVHSPYYLFSMVFHNQREDINEEISKLDYHLTALSDRKLVHCGLLIRREEIYRYTDLEERQKIFRSLYFFALKAPVEVKTIIVNKSECDPDDELSLSTKLVKQLAEFIRQNSDYYRSFENVNVYYDGGQKELGQILHNTFQALLPNVIFRKIVPDEYKLQQVADLFCTLSLLQIKADQNTLSASEKLFFNGRRSLCKDYLKILERKAFDE